jgi:alkanesulfonate monooxygenase SsuD/methylene tetrahydromethanopterin reductase-like flavin-dependent oxidoreductase (luciferase family)
VRGRGRVRVGVTLKMYDYYTYRPKALSEIADQARRAEAIGFDSIWVMDHVFIQRPAGRVLAHDPLQVLAHVVAATSRIAVGSLVLSYPFRHVVQLAREASALSDSSGSRFILGLGTGWHRPEFDAMDLPFDHRVARLEAGLWPLMQLLRGGRTSIASQWLNLADASIAVTSSPPPIWIAAEGPRMLALAARCDGWNHAHWGAEDTSRFRAAVMNLREAIDGAGRQRSDVETSASIACVLEGWHEIPDGFREPEVAVGTAAELAQMIRNYADAGADHVILALSPDPYGEVDAGALERSREILQMV